MREICNGLYLVSIRYVDFQRNQADKSTDHDVISIHIAHLFHNDPRYRHEHKRLVYIYLDLSIHRLIGNQLDRV